MTIRCNCCGWEGDLKSLDMDNTNAPAYCPECGDGCFDIRNIDVRHYELEEKDDDALCVVRLGRNEEGPGN